jgi:uncharacterized protein involved in type VI secretion and phage assembly
MSGDLENLILTTIERWWAGRYTEKHGLVTSYDPTNHLAKVMFQPQGQESGWLPIETGHIGNGFGIAVGLTPGDGKSTGDQVIVRYQEGDIEAGKIVQRVHSDQDKPPTVQSGEVVIWTRFTKTAQGQSGLGDDTTDTGSGDQVGEQGGQQGTGQQIYFKNDGSITITDGNGAALVMDGGGNMTVTSKNHTLNASGNQSVNVGGDKSVSIGGKRGDVVGGLWNALAKFGVWPWLQDDDG